MSVRAIYWKGPGKDVQISGTFTGWKATSMKPIPGTDSWVTSVPVLPENEEQEYKFLVDGAWIHDPNKPTKPNDLGTLNNVIPPAANPSENSMIEVERKFTVPDDFEALLVKHGFKSMVAFESDEDICDIYYDSEGYDLMKEDYWMRSRNGDWELKYPVGVHPTGSTLYHETSDVHEIVSKLQILIPKKSGSKRNSTIFNNIGDFICNQILHKYAELITRRKHYQKENVNIVVDETNWGYKVGEIEMIVKDKSEVPEASKKIDAIARQLNFKKLSLSFAVSKITTH